MQNMKALIVIANSFEREEEQGALSPAVPERNLLSAILARAILDAFATSKCDKHIVKNARRWLFEELAPKRPFSFAWVALELDLDPASLQRSLRGYEISTEAVQERLTRFA